MPLDTHAWSGALTSLVATPRDALLARLRSFIDDATPEQVAAWEQELAVLQEQGATVIELHPPGGAHATVLEYMLPREAGRRPDVLVLQNGRVVVVEFKETGLLRRADVDQVRAYARDLEQYHEACRDQEVIAVLVLCGAGAPDTTTNGVRVIPPGRLAATLVELGRAGTGTPVDLVAFLNGEYAPLPTLVAAARRLFENLPLPHVRRARSAGVHDAVTRVLDHAHAARSRGGRRLILLTGVPGAGKTLVGLQVAHSAALEEGYRFGRQRTRGAPATFLSGNGPLVQVLQHALQNRTFVQDMHRYIREYGLEHPERIPDERVIVFDEAQRAWDAAKIFDFYSTRLPADRVNLRRSEPDLLIEVADRLSDWAVVLALVGDGQEIHTGEEGGMAQWAAAVARSTTGWTIHGPAALAATFAGLTFEADDALNLTVSLRAQAAADLHHWVRLVLDAGDLTAAGDIAARLHRDGFPIYVTRDLNGARSYVRDRFAGEPLRRTGLIASSKAMNLQAHGIDPGFQATKRIQVGPWFNDGPESAAAGTRLETVITEFQCQGLELDLPVVCWGDDLWWDEGWIMRPTRRNPLVRDAHQLRRNAYRVLLTRGREGLVIFVPPEPVAKMDATFRALKMAGAVEARGLVARVA